MLILKEKESLECGIGKTEILHNLAKGNNLGL